MQCGASPLGFRGFHTDSEQAFLVVCQRAVVERAGRTIFAAVRGHFDLRLSPTAGAPSFCTRWVDARRPALAFARRELRFHDPLSLVMESHTLSRGLLLRRDGGWAHHEKDFLALVNVDRGSLLWSLIIHRVHATPLGEPMPTCDRDRAVAFTELGRCFAKLHSSLPQRNVGSVSASMLPCFRDFVHGVVDRLCDRKCLFASRSHAAVTMLRWGAPPFLKVPLPFMAKVWRVDDGTPGAIQSLPAWWLAEKRRWEEVFRKHECCEDRDPIAIPCAFEGRPGGCSGVLVAGNVRGASKCMRRSICPYAHDISRATRLARVRYGMHENACRVCHGYANAKCRGCKARYLLGNSFVA